MGTKYTNDDKLGRYLEGQATGVGTDAYSSLGARQRSSKAAPSASQTSGSSVEAPAEIKKFLGLGLLLLAWHLTPDEGATGAAWIVPSTCYLLGAIGLFNGFRETDEWELNPFAGRGILGGVLNFIRLWAWALLWPIIIAGLIWYGSPHLRIAYDHGALSSNCTYLGINGLEPERFGSADCPLVEFIPLR